MRPLIQYDLGEPPTAPTAVSPPPDPAAHCPPTKKRKRNHRDSQSKKHQPGAWKFPPQHWDDPGNAADDMIYDEQRSSGAIRTSYTDNVGEGEEDECEEEAMAGHETVDAHEEEEQEQESRQLTHGEIWDDSALIDAWRSAEAEYEAYHGTSKSWKTEPVKKSPLWYNKPYTAPPQPDLESDTVPLDFHTFIPTHDPSLAVPTDTAAKSTPKIASTPFFAPPSSMTTVSRDEAFNNALTAMYWSGYWTAVYHCQSGKGDDVQVEATEEPGDEADEDGSEEDLVPAQR